VRVAEIAPIVGLPPETVRNGFLEGPGCDRRNGHDAASADAALLAVIQKAMTRSTARPARAAVARLRPAGA
jgi:hypothetical protein